MKDWMIVDHNGIIHSGDEATMKLAFDVMRLNSNETRNARNLSIKRYERLCADYKFPWHGDLMLAQIHILHN